MMNPTAIHEQPITAPNQGKHGFLAGFNLLDKFQSQWEQIHSKSEKNVIKAKEALSKLNQVEQSTVNRLHALDELNASMKLLVKLDDQINNIHNDLKVLQESFVKITDLLIVLKNNKESNDTTQYLNSLQANYESQAQQMKTRSLVQRERLKQEHLKRVELYEEKQQQELEERRLVLEKAFEEEKIRYLENKSKKS